MQFKKSSPDADARLESTTESHEQLAKLVDLLSL